MHRNTYTTVRGKVYHIQQAGEGLNERQQKIIAFIKKHKKAQIKDIDKAFAAYSRNTLKKTWHYL
jgi:hypothetical protein